MCGERRMRLFFWIELGEFFSIRYFVGDWRRERLGLEGGFWGKILLGLLEKVTG